MSTKRMLVAVAVAGLVAAGGGSAFTNTNTVATSIAGYGTNTISGATATSVVYALSADSTQITGATIVFTGDVSARLIKAGFGAAGANQECTSKTYDGATSTNVVCTFLTPASTADAQQFNVAVG